MTSRRSHRTGALLAAVLVLLAAGCIRDRRTTTTTTTTTRTATTTTTSTRPPTSGSTSTSTTRSTTTTTHDHGGGGNQDHPPTPEQLTQLRRLVTETRTYALAHWPTTVQVTADRNLQFVHIGDGVHYSSKVCRQDKTPSGTPKPHIGPGSFGPGYDTFDWTCPESLVMRGGRLAAVMYQLPDHMDTGDIPDMGGNLTLWHGHPLCFGSNNPESDDYYRIAGGLIGNSCTSGFYRGVSPMIHVWVVDHQCGPFAGTVRSEGSCVDIDL
jgi:hypothetical protein